ncbi:MAG: LysE family transporter [Alphaproteobacteria bacterium]|nr:LysE family transporter [Alphaproteobacteria bacterium]
MQEFYLYLPGILLAYAAFSLGIFSPGPNILAIIGTSMSVGRKSGIALAMGVATGSFTWAMLTAVGLSALLTQYAYALFVIKIVGGLYLLWLGYKSLRSAMSDYDLTATTLDGETRTAFGYYSRGYIVQMTNPKAALSWVAIISLGLAPDAPLWVAAVIVTGATLMSIIMHYVYAVAFSTNLMVRVYSKARKYIQATLGIFFVGAGIKLLSGK